MYIANEKEVTRHNNENLQISSDESDESAED